MVGKIPGGSGGAEFPEDIPSKREAINTGENLIQRFNARLDELHQLEGMLAADPVQAKNTRTKLSSPDTTISKQDLKGRHAKRLKKIRENARDLSANPTTSPPYKKARRTSDIQDMFRAGFASLAAGKKPRADEFEERMRSKALQQRSVKQKSPEDVDLDKLQAKIDRLKGDLRRSLGDELGGG